MPLQSARFVKRKPVRFVEVVAHTINAEEIAKLEALEDAEATLRHRDNAVVAVPIIKPVFITAITE